MLGQMVEDKLQSEDKTPTDTSNLDRVKLVFMYTKTGKGGKPTYKWLGMADNSIRLYRGPHNRNIIAAKPGMIFTFPEKDGSLYHNQWAMVDEQYPDQDAVIVWAALDRAYWLEHKAKLKLAKALKEDILIEHTNALMLAYHSLPGVSKEQFLAWMVSRITRGE